MDTNTQLYQELASELIGSVISAHGGGLPRKELLRALKETIREVDKGALGRRVFVEVSAYGPNSLKPATELC